MPLRPIALLTVVLIATLEARADPRLVTGHIILPANITALPSFTMKRVRLMTIVNDPEITYPDEYVMWTPEQRHAWYLDYLKTGAGKAYKIALDQAEASKHVVDLTLDPQGAFRATGVPPGRYQFIADAAAQESGAEIHFIATSSDTLTIPDGQPNQPCDLGAINLSVNRNLEPGDFAPDFTVKTLDGKDLRLSDYKGKVILLNFWATWCGPCVAEIPAIKATRDAFAADPRFIIINLSLDDRPSRVEHVVEKNEIHWPQGFLGDWYQSAVRESFGVQKIPALFLIGPDGKILVKNLSGADIQPAVASALGK
jgi:peroxiredoxin